MNLQAEGRAFWGESGSVSGERSDCHYEGDNREGGDCQTGGRVAVLVRGEKLLQHVRTFLQKARAVLQKPWKASSVQEISTAPVDVISESMAEQKDMTSG